MIDFMALRLKPIDLYNLKKGERHSVLFAKPNDQADQPVVWYSTELMFSEDLGMWESCDSAYPSYWYNSTGTAQSCPKPHEDWSKLQLFSPHEKLL